MVTVSTGVQSPPKSIFGLLPCGPSSGGFYTIGCMTSGFSPADSVNFKWTDGSGTALSDIVQYPAVQKNGAYTKISHVNVKAQDWKDRKPFKCVAEGAGVIKETILEPATVHKQSASLYLTNPSETELAKGTATYVCLAKDFSPKEHSFKWLKNNEEVTDKKYIFSTSIKEEKNGMHTLYTATSVLQLDSSAWNYPATPTVRCEFKQQDKTLFKEAKSSTVHCACEPKIEIIPPTAEDMLKEKAGSLKCVVSGCPVMVDKITWKSGEDVRVSDTTHGQDSTISTTHISYEDWNALTFTCEVHHKGFVNPESLTYRRENGGEYRCPSVYLLPPPEQTNGKVTLICYVKHFFPREVVVSWLVNDEPVDKTQEYEQKTTNVLQSKGLFSVYGQLTFDTSLWEKGNVYTCQVYHETGETVSITTRTIDKSSQKSALNMPKICKDSGN